MTDKHTQSMAGQSNMEKDPDQWVTGDEPMTGAQRSYLKTLCEEAKEDFDERLTKAEASKRIEELQATTGRGEPKKYHADATDEAKETAEAGGGSAGATLPPQPPTRRSSAREP